jgi:hypothetical protein
MRSYSSPRDLPVTAPADPSGFRSVVVLIPRGSPSLDYYLQNIRDRATGAEMHLIESGRLADESLSISAGSWLVVVRHAQNSWIKWLARRRENFARVTWFLDDDVARAASERTLPRLYAWRTFLRYFLVQRKLHELATDMAFSTTELAARYPEKPSEIWLARQVAAPSGLSPMTYFYHGTAAHRAELRWLVPIVAEVQRRVPAAWFEVFADRKAREFFRGIPRVRCIYPMAWPDYLAYTATFRAEVGLAPLLDTPFNRARAPVKFFDIARTGAAGIYSAGPTYGNKIRDGLNGLLLPNDPQQWTEAIVHLLLSPGHRSRIAEQAAIDCNATRTE